MVTLGQQFSRDCIQLENRIGSWSKNLKAKLNAVHREVGARWKAEAIKRVPVDTGTLKTRILSNVYVDQAHIYVTEVGTNIEDYPVYLEFGTEYIAKGAVLRLGDSTEITDQQAIHMWPAKEAEAEKWTSFSIDTDGKRRNQEGKLAGIGHWLGGPQEQMPWLRPAFNSIKTWVIDSLNQTIEI